MGGIFERYVDDSLRTFRVDGHRASGRAAIPRRPPILLDRSDCSGVTPDCPAMDDIEVPESVGYCRGWILYRGLCGLVGARPLDDASCYESRTGGQRQSERDTDCRGEGKSV